MYPAFSVDGVSEDAHRVAYRMNKGEIPYRSVVMHSCDNKRCVNPDHLSLGSYGDNLQDAYDKGITSKKGMKHHLAKFTDQDILKIRSLKGSMKQYEIAKRYGVVPQTISRILSGKRWSHL